VKTAASLATAKRARAARKLPTIVTEAAIFIDECGRYTENEACAVEYFRYGCEQRVFRSGRTG
jgi:hypothetical protein